jgi:hypothetical protein
MINFCKLWFKNMHVLVKRKQELTAVSATFKSLLHMSEVRKSTVHTFHPVLSTYIEDPVYRGKPTTKKS